VPVPPSLAEAEQRKAFAQWFRSERARNNVPKGRLAAALGHDSTQQINKYLDGRVLPMPTTLRRLCEALGSSWPAAFANAGYYQQIIELLAALHLLGDRWRQEDHTLPREDWEFRSVGVYQIADLPFHEALKNPKFAARYHAGFWDLPPSDVDVSGIDVPEHRELLSRMAKQPHRTWCTVPKPIAAAIFIAVAGLPRRGDIYKDGFNAYGAHVLENLDALATLAENLAPSPCVLPDLLERALETLRDPTIPLNNRRPIASEYIQIWADSVCQRYTYYARLSVFFRFGEAGSSRSTVTLWERMPEFEPATAPNPETFNYKIVS
jgi:transcriptional regulator with XRE-family HTH domain